MFRDGRFPYGWSFIGDDDIAATSEALLEDILTTGPKVAEFETAFANAVGAEFAVSCNTGTAALHLACKALDIGPGDYVIVPALTFAATANVVRHCGGEVVFADVHPDTGLMDETHLSAASKRRDRIKAAIPVHLNGHACDMEPIGNLADSLGIAVVEDACHAIGTTYRSARTDEINRYSIGACAHSDAACFSFHPVKTMTTGEGGMVATNDIEIARQAAALRTQGITRENIKHPEFAYDAKGKLNPWYYEMHDLGHSFRLTDFQCALGLSQLAKLSAFKARRAKMRARYDEHFRAYKDVLKPVPAGADADSCLHLYPLLIEFDSLDITRAQLMRKLAQEKVGAQVHYIPVPMHPYYVERYGRQEFPGAEAYYRRVLSIPFYYALTDEQIDHIAGTLLGALGLK